MSCTTEAVPGRQTFDCQANKPIAVVVCEFDGKQKGSCSFPLVVTIDRFGTEKHTLNLLFIAFDDVFQREEISFDFQLVERKCVTNTRNLVLNNYNFHANIDSNQHCGYNHNSFHLLSF